MSAAWLTGLATMVISSVLVWKDVRSLQGQGQGGGTLQGQGSGSLLGQGQEGGACKEKGAGVWAVGGGMRWSNAR